jgi:hypothetical protein
VIRHPADAAYHHPAFDRYFHNSYTAETLAVALTNAARTGIGVEATVMIGLPGDAANSIQHSTNTEPIVCQRVSRTCGEG